MPAQTFISGQSGIMPCWSWVLSCSSVFCLPTSTHCSSWTCSSPGPQHPVQIWVDMQIRSEAVPVHNKRSLSLCQSKVKVNTCTMFLLYGWSLYLAFWADIQYIHGDLDRRRFSNISSQHLLATITNCAVYQMSAEQDEKISIHLHNNDENWIHS